MATDRLTDEQRDLLERLADDDRNYCLPGQYRDALLAAIGEVVALRFKTEGCFAYKFLVGQRVRKPKGYSFDGVIVAAFVTTAGERRVVAELTTPNGRGMLHIFAEDQLELATTEAV